MAYTMRVVEVDNAVEHDLPADTVTRDAPPGRSCTTDRRAPEYGSDGGAQGPLLPLAFRLRNDVFYVWSERWPDLIGKALELKTTGSR
jgi:hypothetical protein